MVVSNIGSFSQPGVKEKVDKVVQALNFYSNIHGGNEWRRRIFETNWVEPKNPSAWLFSCEEHRRDLPLFHGSFGSLCQVNRKEKWFNLMLIAHTQKCIVIPKKKAGEFPEFFLPEEMPPQGRSSLTGSDYTCTPAASALDEAGWWCRGYAGGKVPLDSA